MDRYKLDVTLTRTVVERYSVEVDANDPEEAQDIAYDYMSEYPNSTGAIRPEKLLKVTENNVSTHVDDVSFVRSSIEKIFGDNDEPDGDNIA